MRNPVARGAFRFGLYTGMRLTEVIALASTQVDMASMTIRIEDTKNGEPLEFPVTRQLAAILECRFAEREQFTGEARGWVFPSEASASGHLEAIQHLNARIGEAGEERFWFHALRHSFASDGLLVDEGLPMTGKLLGNNDIETTARYPHLARDPVHEEAGRIADSIDTDIL